MKKIAAILACCVLPVAAQATDWKPAAELGLVVTTGNSDTTNINGKLALHGEDEQWIHDLGALYVQARDYPAAIESLQKALAQSLPGVRYAEIADAMRTARYPSVFQASIVVGRRMSVWYRSKDHAFTVKVNGTEQPFWVGTYFCNGDASQKSLKATTTLFNRFGGCLAGFDRNGRYAKTVGAAGRDPGFRN